MSKIIMSAFADEYSKDIDTQLSMLNEHGIGYIEPRFIGDKNIADLDKNEAKELKKKIDDAGIRVSSIGSPLGKINLDDDINVHLEKTKRVCETACILGTDSIRVFSFYLRDGQPASAVRNEVIEKLGKMIDIAVSAGVDFCHENEARIYGESPENCLDLMKTFDGKLKCVFDMGNFVLDGFKPYPDAYMLLRDHIKYFHIKDALFAGAIVPAGCGEASIGDILKAHKEYTDSDFIVTLEPHLETFSGLNQLVGKKFDNPYKFNSAEEAFVTAINKLKEIIK